MCMESRNPLTTFFTASQSPGFYTFFLSISDEWTKYLKRLNTDKKQAAEADHLCHLLQFPDILENNW